MEPVDTPPDTRRRLLSASSELFRRNGFTGTALKAILDASGVPSGSLYHFFPDGKEQLGVAALESGGAAYRDLVRLIFADDVDVEAATTNFFEGAAYLVESTDYADGCPVATVALEVSNRSEPMRDAAARAFESWMAILEHRFIDAGISQPVARNLAVELFCAVEGAFLLARVTRDAEPLRVAGKAAATSVRSALRSD